MKNRPLSTSLVLLLAAALLAVVVPAGRALAQNPPTDKKIRLMSEALRARDTGDLEGALKTIGELSALAPNDASVNRLRSEIEALRTAKAEAAVRAEAQRAAQIEADARAEARRAAAAVAAQQAAAMPPAPTRVESPPQARSAPTMSATVAAAPAPVMVDVKIPEPGQSASAPPPQPPGPTPEQEVEAMARAESARIMSLMAGAQTMLSTAHSQARDGRNDEAIATVDAALASLPSNPLTQKLIADLKREKASALLDKAQALLKKGDTEGARAALAAHEQLAPADTRGASVASKIASADAQATAVGPAFLAERDATAKLIAKGRAQYVAGDIDGAQETFRQVEAQQPDNTVAKGFLVRIANEKAETGALNREKTRAQLLEEVAKSWQRPGIYQERARGTDNAAAIAPLAKKLNDIVLPSVSFTRAEIGQVVTALSAASEEYDTTGTGMKGVNIVLIDPSNKNPLVTLTLRNVTLKRLLDMVTEQVGYQYEVQADLVVVRPGGETSTLDTAFFPITRATVLRMTGIAGAGGGSGGGNAGKPDPYASGGGASAGTEPSVTGGEAAGMKGFFQQAGVSFAVEGSSLAYDGSAIIVTQSARNMDRIRNILARYNDVRQVEIEAKFMEVQEGALDELGVTWNLSRRGIPQINPATGAPVLDANGRQVFTPQETYTSSGVTRPLSGAFPSTSNQAALTIQEIQSAAVPNPQTITIPVAPTQIPGGVQLGSTAGALSSILGFVGEFDVSAVIRALSQKQGTDLLSSPKLTIMSGTPGSITVAQELRYPQSYGEIQSQVGSGASAGAGGISSAGVTITAGTPQEFTSRNVGVELKVTPTVEEDDYSISLDLNPKVTEFEGFVEYGGPSVAISSGVTVTVPPGFYQPIFSVRDISTKVTIWDGATLVMGGLTREEVKKVNDKIPFFGDLPFVGRLFRSKGESAQKKNLLIFVTANLVSPGGSPKKQNLKSTPANSLFQNPTIVTPSSAEPRTRSGDK